MLWAGDVVGDYEVIDYVGSGGMASVYRIRHRASGAERALKVLQPRLAADPEVRDRFLSEARIQADLAHPNVVAVAEEVEADGSVGLVMEYLDGPTLREHLAARGGPLPVAEIRALLLPLAEAAALAHARGVVHRDIKPENVKVQPQEGGWRPVLLDFGVAHVGEAAPPAQRRRWKTLAGRRIGTPGHMAPEQVQGLSAITPAADVFALGVILYEMVTGRRPFEGPSDFEIMRRIVAGQREPAAKLAPGAPPALLACVERALQVDPLQRYPDAAAFADALRRATAPPRRGRALLRALAAAGVLAALWGAGSLVAPLWGRFERERAADLAAEAMEKLEHHKTDIAANADPALLREARALADQALAARPTPQAREAAALAAVWGEGWQLSSFDEDDLKRHLPDTDALTAASLEPPTGGALLARALVAAAACTRLPAGDRRRTRFCEEADERFAQSEALLAGDERGWLRLELRWSWAEHDNRLADAFRASNRDKEAKARWRQAADVCARAEGDLAAGPVNDVWLARQCLVSFGAVQDFAAYFRWSRWLRGHDEAAGALTSPSVARVYQAAHPACGDLARRSGGGEPWRPQVSGATSHFCQAAGLLALSCPDQAKDAARAGRRKDPRGTLPWAALESAWEADSRGCYLDQR